MINKLATFDTEKVQVSHLKIRFVSLLFSYLHQLILKNIKLYF